MLICGLWFLTFHINLKFFLAISLPYLVRFIYFGTAFILWKCNVMLSFECIFHWWLCLTSMSIQQMFIALWFVTINLKWLYVIFVAMLEASNLFHIWCIITFRFCLVLLLMFSLPQKSIVFFFSRFWHIFLLVMFLS